LRCMMKEESRMKCGWRPKCLFHPSSLRPVETLNSSSTGHHYSVRYP
jgi:hypothetical protein